MNNNEHFILMLLLVIFIITSNFFKSVYLFGYPLNAYVIVATSIVALIFELIYKSKKEFFQLLIFVLVANFILFFLIL